LEREALEAVAADPAPRIAATGGGIVTDPGNVKRMRARGVVLWVDRPPEDILGDLRQDTRPLLAGDAAERLGALNARRAPLYRAAAHLRLENRGAPGEALEQALALLGSGGHRRL
jgi:shikimate kinase